MLSTEHTRNSLVILSDSDSHFKVAEYAVLCLAYMYHMNTAKIICIHTYPGYNSKTIKHAEYLLQQENPQINYITYKDCVYLTEWTAYFPSERQACSSFSYH